MSVLVPLPLEYAACREAGPMERTSAGWPVTWTISLKVISTSMALPRS